MARCGQLFATWEEIKVIAENDDEVDVEVVDISDSESESEEVFEVIPEESILSSTTDLKMHVKSEDEGMTVEEITVMPEISLKCLHDDDSSTMKLIQNNEAELILPCDTTELNAIEEHPNLVPVIVKTESIAAFLMPDSTTERPLTCLPASNNWDGTYNFKIAFSLDPSNKKCDSTVFCKSKQKIYTSKDMPFRILCSAIGAPPGSVIRATGVFVMAEHAFEVVKRCPTHAQEDIVKGHPAYEHVVQSLSEHAFYEKNLMTGRYSVIVPYEAPQDGTKDSIYVYKLTCYSSCSGGLNRRPMMLLFTLEKDGVHLGRQSFEVKVCACPNRDMRLDENKLVKQKNRVLDNQCQPKSTLENKSSHEPETETNYTMKVKDPKLYEFLQEMKTLYETGSCITHFKKRPKL